MSWWKPKPPKPPTPPQPIPVPMSAWFEGQMFTAATATLIPDQFGGKEFVATISSEGRYLFTLPPTTNFLWGAWVHVEATQSTAAFDGRVNIGQVIDGRQVWQIEDIAIEAANQWPEAPDRMTVLESRVPFQGFTAQTSQYGAIRAWGPEIGWLNDDDAAEYVQQAMAFTDRSGQRFDGLEFAVSAMYRGYPVPGQDFTKNLPELRRRVKNAIIIGAPLGLNGVKIFCAGDGTGAGPGYNDPQGWTYGVEWLIANFQGIFDAFGPQPDDPTDLRDWLVFLPSYDGLDAYQADRDHIVQVWQTMRKAVDAAGHGYTGFEWPMGQIGLGDNYPTYTPENGGCVDVWLLEGPACPYPPTADADIQKLTQQTGRAIRPYVRPSWAIDDPNPPLYIPQTCARGETVVQQYEFGTYLWVNQDVPTSVIDDQRDVLRAMCPGAVVC